ncbi:MAG: hypothetical protein JO253_02875 [Alphaproteobacteria bacterium]|nr:hypothetical protein [Alphaproteobacteria bacterium]
MNNIYQKTSASLESRERGKCMVTRQRGKLDIVYYPIPREAAESIDWAMFHAACAAGIWGEAARRFDWVAFFDGATNGVPVDPYQFVDNMLVNGLLLLQNLSKEYTSSSFGAFVTKAYQRPVPNTSGVVVMDAGNGNPPPPPPDGK